jgi:glycosyltransferase involved in cell wall biosynthesis
MKSTDKCKILFVLPSLRCAGAETQVTDLIRGFDATRFEITLVTFGSDLTLLDRLEGTSCRHFNFPRKSKFDFTAAREIRRVIDELGIDIVHCTLQIALLMGWLGARRAARKPAVVTALHRTVARNLKEDVVERLVYQLPMRSSQSIVCVCDAQRGYWSDKFKGIAAATKVIYNGVDPAHYEPAQFAEAGAGFRKGLGIPTTAAVITSVAGLRVEKNHVGMVRAFAAVAADHPEAYLLFAGDGPERDKITPLILEHNLEGRVLLLGKVTDVRPLLAASDATVLASTAIETFSIAMLESMAMGKPVISSDIGGHREAISSGVTGYLVPIGDTPRLSEAFAAALSDRDNLKRMGEQARRVVMERFSLRKMVEETENLVLTACGRGV